MVPGPARSLAGAATVSALNALDQSACPQCGKQYAAAAGSGRLYECVKCKKVWSVPGTGDNDTAEPRCAQHPGRRALWACESCMAPACAACTTTRSIGSGSIRMSSCCNESVLPVPPVHEVDTIGSSPLELLAYPLRPRGLAIFAILLVGLSLPLISWVILLLLAGYLTWILRTSAEGGKHLPDLPDIQDAWSGIGLPLVLLGFSLAVALSPMIFYRLYRGWETADPLVWVLYGWAVCVFPIVAMVSTITRSIFPALNPVNLFRIIRAIPDTYLFVVLYIALLAFVVVLLRPFLTTGPLAFLRLALDLYVVFVTAHLLGRAIHETQGKVEWLV